MLRMRSQRYPSYAGDVLVTVTKNKRIDVPVAHEELVIERHPVTSVTAATAFIRRGTADIAVPLSLEEARIENTGDVHIEEDTDHGNAMLDADEAAGRTTNNFESGTPDKATGGIIMADLITGLFHDRAQAEKAVNDLENLGYSQNDISVMMNDKGEARDFADGTGTKAAEGAGVGAGIGGTLGAIIAALTATGSVAAVAATGGLAVPLVAGPLAAALAGAGAGGLTGGIIGGLVGAGIPEDRAAGYETGLNAGGILIGVHATDAQASEVRRVLEGDGADDVQGPSGYQGDTAAQTHFINTAPAAGGTGVDADATPTDYVPPAGTAR